MSDPSASYDADLFGSRFMPEGRKAPPARNGIERGALSYVHGIIPDAQNREPNDFYPTPPRSTRALLEVEDFDGEILIRRLRPKFNATFVNPERHVA